MTAADILIAAMLAQGLLALALLWLLGARRLPLVASQQIKIGDIALSDDPWPEAARQASNAFSNQFQLPVLFYLACGIALYFGAGWLEAALAVAFVVSRLGHALVHVTTNRVTLRFKFYTAGYFVLCAFWLTLVGHFALNIWGN